MKILSLLLIVLSLPNQAFSSELSRACSDRNGVVKSRYTCPKSNIPLPIKTCVYENSYGETQFFNGCSGPSGGHGKLFYNSCIKHDLCYHHEPATNGFSQKTCDKNLLSNMNSACDGGAKNIARCKKWARILYRGLRIVGAPAYHCANDFSRSYTWESYE
jgi:hypothetical protein